MRQLFMLLPLINFPWQSELPFCYALRTVRKIGEEPIPDFKFCHLKIPEIAWQHTLFSARIEDYFDFQQGVLRLDRMSLQKLNDKCTGVPSTQMSLLIVKIQEYLSTNQVLFIGEDHLDYLSLNRPAGVEVVKCIMQYFSEHTLVFTESESFKNKLEGKKIPIVALDDQSYDTLFCRAILVYYTLLKIDDRMGDAQMNFMKAHITDLFLYNGEHSWSKFCKNLDLESEEAKLCTRIIKAVKKAKKSASGNELERLVGEKLFSLFQKNKADTFNFFIKFIQSSVPKLKKFDDPVTEEARIAGLEKFRKTMEVFLNKLNPHDVKSLSKSNWEDFKHKANEFIVQHRNILWAEKINQEVNKYKKLHKMSSPPHIVMIAGHSHSKHLQLVLGKKLQRNLPHPDL